MVSEGPCTWLTFFSIFQNISERADAVLGLYLPEVLQPGQANRLDRFRFMRKENILVLIVTRTELKTKTSYVTAISNLRAHPGREHSGCIVVAFAFRLHLEIFDLLGEYFIIPSSFLVFAVNRRMSPMSCELHRGLIRLLRKLLLVYSVFNVCLMDVNRGRLVRMQRILAVEWSFEPEHSVSSKTSVKRQPRSPLTRKSEVRRPRRQLCSHVQSLSISVPHIRRRSNRRSPYAMSALLRNDLVDLP